MRTSPIASTAIALWQSAPSFEAAVVGATQLLVSEGHVLQGYVNQVLDNLASLGPYFVVAPEIAIAHAKPSEQVLSPGVALLKLAEPVLSGSQLHDSVSLIFAIATPTVDAHLELMGSLAERLSEPETINNLLNASAESVIWEILNS